MLAFEFLLMTVSLVSAGPIAYGICQAGCAGVVMACPAAARENSIFDSIGMILMSGIGATWGGTAGLSAPASMIACNAAFGSCQAAYAVVALAPTP